MDLKSLLGDAYKEGMTIDEIEAAIADKTFVDPSSLPPSVAKSQFDSKVSELAATKKELENLKNQNLTDEQKVQQALADAKQAESDFKKKSVRLDVEKIFVSAGLEQKDYDSFIDGIVSEDSSASTELAQKLVTMLDSQKKATESAVRKELRGKLPDPPSGGDGSVTKEAFDKMSVTEKMKLKAEHPEIYKELNGGN